jgi:putative transposase
VLILGEGHLRAVLEEY